MVIQSKSGRFHLRSLRLSDAEQINSSIRDPRIYQNVARIPPNQTIDNTKQFILDREEKVARKESFVKTIVDGKRVIGCISASPFPNHPFLDVGYWIAPTYWGKGIATEAVSIFLDWMFQEENVIFVTAGYFVDNPASGRVLRKCGFLTCGRSKYHCLGRDATVECVDMAYCM